MPKAQAGRWRSDACSHQSSEIPAGPPPEYTQPGCRPDPTHRRLGRIRLPIWDLGLAVHLIQASMRGSLQALLPNASLWPLYPVPMSHGLKKRHQHSCRQHRQGLVCHAVAAKEALMQHGAISLQGTSRSRNEDRYDVAVSAQCCSYIDHGYLGLPHAHAGRSHAAYACSPAALHQPVSDRSSSCAEAGQPL